MAIEQSADKRFLALDTLRGVAALGVMIGHYEHFTSAVTPPLYNELLFFYDHAGRLVEFFICLSGFIFFWKYRSALFNHKIGLRDFMILRLSRLYPLHLLTLFLLVFLQLIYYSINKSYFLYQYNDLYHFIVNLLFLNSGFISSGWSFNAPSWSVSIEIMMYFVFFFFCTLRFRPVLTPISLAVLGVFLIKHHDLMALPTVVDTLGMGLSCFFVGGASYLVYVEICNFPAHLQRLVGNLISATFLLLLTLILLGLYGHTWAMNAVGDVRLVLILSVFPLAILAGVTDNFLRSLIENKLTAHFGDISYAIYLVHIPVQVTLMCLSTAFLDVNYSNAWVLLIYVVVCILLAEIVYFRFELPAKIFLRDKLVKRPSRL